ncbi:hypothetical protein FIBSPDRAFT_970412 [Athelia psychrophila]|uniref:Uncharacterized protein n=1 Tax=Athelia psychrophila TaxID=1759441 RepID=A0A167SQ58_9AGAM|nr:hypothetical protein FIBSPDRAFT_970412 [Fibularhizoctonia sp. CBS 109695]
MPSFSSLLEYAVLYAFKLEFKHLYEATMNRTLHLLDRAQHTAALYDHGRSSPPISFLYIHAVET